MVGPNSPSAPGIESTLDIQYQLGVAPFQETTFWSLAEFSLYNWITAVNNAEKPPQVHSVSYGNDEEQNGKSYMERTNTEFQKSGVRGITVLFASGDQGVWGRTGIFQFHPDFPGASPYITAVGATQFPGADITQEVGTIWSGGGFSRTFNPASYQADALKTYFGSASLPPKFFWNDKGAGYPDIATNGGGNQPYCILTNGADGGVAGTSASCPTMSAIFSLLNNIRINAGKPVLGYVNPLLYQWGKEQPQVYKDVTSGKNTAGKLEGFPAVKGWDPVTGWGNPSYEEMAKVVNAMF